ncbi:hypothetical protein AGLY_016764 [Aphis glycines]|uniref:Uncharacterized protein n=1 Tax=Aphis glycines TaxID=307491 RepID=A0A6G0SX12_APHGL|nr:hypothetical protein AGLY_016764 [Aphis glycines]
MYEMMPIISPNTTRTSIILQQANPKISIMSLTLALNKSSNQKHNPQILFKHRRDKESIRGVFTWLKISKYNIPAIVRVTNGERSHFVSVRMAETNILKKYLPSLHSDLLEVVFVKFYLMTHYEAKLFNEINRLHSNNFYGENSFSTSDYIVRFEDMYEFYEFIEFCYTKLFYHIIPDLEEKCGFLRINFKSVVPYIMKDSIKYIPLHCFDFIDKNLTQQYVKIEDWSLAYLKFCCKVQGITENLCSNESCKMISIDVIKNYFSPKSHFEEFWPDDFNKSQLINDNIEAKESSFWIRKSLVIATVTKNTTTHNSKTTVIPHSMSVITNVQELKKKQMELSEIQQGSSIIINNTVNVPQLPPTSTQALNNQEEKVYTPICDVQLKRKSEQLLHGTSKKNAYKGLSEIQQGSNAINSIVKVPQLPPPPSPPPSTPPSPPPAIPLF